MNRSLEPNFFEPHESIHMFPKDGKLVEGLNIFGTSNPYILHAVLLDPSGEIASGSVNPQNNSVQLITKHLKSDISLGDGQGAGIGSFSVGRSGADRYSRLVQLDLVWRADMPQDPEISLHGANFRNGR